MPDEAPPQRSPDPTLLKHHLLHACGLIEEALSEGGSESPWRSGFQGLSLLTGSDGGGELRLVLGPPGAGKSSLAASLVSRLIDDGGEVEHLAWFSLQESGAQTAMRLLGLTAGMPWFRVAAGDVSSRRDLLRLTKVMHALAEYPVHIADKSPLSVAELRARCEEWKKQGDLPLILIDPVEALEDEEGNRWGSSPQASEDIACSLRLLAQDLRRPILAFASTPCEPDAASFVPDLALLPESFARLVAAADRVFYLKVNSTQPGDCVAAAALHVLKQGDDRSPGIIPLSFRPDLLLFESMDKACDIAERSRKRLGFGS